MTEVNFNRIAELLAAHGITARIDGTAACSTLQIGTACHEEGWGDRYQLLAGPGDNRRAWGDAWADPQELVIGRDDDGTSPVLWRGDASDTEETVAAVIVTLLARPDTGRAADKAANS